VEIDLYNRNKQYKPFIFIFNMEPFSNNSKSFKEQRIRKITQLYYSRPDIKKAIFEFSKNREIVPKYFEGFGKRPDSFQYSADMFELVKRGATSFHCSEEIWEDPLKIITGMPEQQANELRIGWDLLIDIDSKYIDYSKILANIIISMLKFHGIKNIGVKFSGNKGFHIILPWKAFPKEINGIETKNMFPEWPRIIVNYLIEQTKNQLIEKITELTKTSKYVKDFQASKEVLPDVILVSPRHLFRMPYSLHEKTALSSVVLIPEEIENFQIIEADPLKVKVRNFIPNSEEGEAKELLIQALDWYEENVKPRKDYKEKQKISGKSGYDNVKIENLSDKNFPPCVKKILNGIADGKKRALFVLINLFRSVGIEKDKLEQLIEEWNTKNNPQLRQSYINPQFSWSYRNKPIMPPNCKQFYQGIGVCAPDEFCRLIKNPVNYVIRKSFQESKKIKETTKSKE